jgi:preprotein translocase subunit YajC
LVFLGAVILGFYLLIIRPAQSRQREAAAVVARLSAGQEVMTTAGIFGTLRAVDDESVLIEVCPGTTIKYARVAIARIISDPAEPDLNSPAGSTRPDDDRESND